jgi:hypothetical protein
VPFDSNLAPHVVWQRFAALAASVTPERAALLREHTRLLDEEPAPEIAVAVAGKRNDSISFNEPLREIHERDENGAHVIRFLGMRSFVHDMKPFVASLTSGHRKVQLGPTGGQLHVRPVALVPFLPRGTNKRRSRPDAYGTPRVWARSNPAGWRMTMNEH